MRRFAPRNLAWQRDLPDFRDYSLDHPEVRELLGRLPESTLLDDPPPTRIDLREYFPRVFDQDELDSSAANACVGMLEYFERRAHGHTTPLSRLFLHQMACRLANACGTADADLRTCLKAVVRFGLPPERFYPYHPERIAKEPEAFLFSFADRFRALRYLRLDGRNSTGSETLQLVKAFLAAGFPCIFGFVVPSSLTDDPDIPYRPTFDTAIGGQAVVAVGYDDRRLRATKGALLIRSSWSETWGEGGYGWLPYAFVENQLAADFWTVLRPDWIASGEFAQPLEAALGDGRE